MNYYFFILNFKKNIYICGQDIFHGFILMLIQFALVEFSLVGFGFLAHFDFSTSLIYDFHIY